MRGMGWSWADLEAAPVYVRRFCADFLSLRAEAEASQDDPAPADTGGATRKRAIQHDGW